MPRWFLFPAVAAALWSQQTPPAATTDAATTLRDRVQQFYQLQQDKKYRQAEALVADDTKDDYYNGKKPDIKGFTVESVEFLDSGHTRAKVIVKAKVLVLMMGAGAQLFDMLTPTTWKVENGDWRWYIAPEARVQTPFGNIKTGDASAASPAKPFGTLDTKGQAPGGIDSPDVGALQGQVSISSTAVTLGKDSREQSVTITNRLPGPCDLALDPHVKTIKGLAVEIDKPHLDAGEKALVHLRLNGDNKIADVVEIIASPLNQVFDIRVKAN